MRTRTGFAVLTAPASSTTEMSYEDRNEELRGPSIVRAISTANATGARQP